MQFHAVCILSCVFAVSMSMPAFKQQKEHHYFSRSLSQGVPESCPSEKAREEVLRRVQYAEAPYSLDKHSEEFNEPRRIEVMPKVHVFIGYYLSNTIVIEAPEGLIVVDTGDCISGAQNVIRDIRSSVSDKQFKAVILTHNHPDHVGGTQAYQDTQPNTPIDVWGYEGLEEEFWKKWEYINPLLLARSLRQFGINLPAGASKNAGLGYKLMIDEKSGLLVMPPDHYLSEEQMDVNIAGLDLTLMRIPGETNDQMGVYIPSMKAFLIGDDYYKTFPNIYTIRGTPVRDAEKWFEAIDKIRRLDIEYLIPSHTQPVIGKKQVLKDLTNYRDAIQFVFDQTIRLMNKGMHPEEIAQTIKLPETIKHEPNLLEHYGMVEWSSKAIYDSKVGWFSGYPEDLFPLTPTEMASRWMDVVHPHDLLHHANLALKAGSLSDIKWALHLSTFVWHSRENPLTTSDLLDRAREIRTNSLIALASLQTSPNARNYYLSWVLQENCNRPIPASTFTDVGTLSILPIDKVLRKLSLLVKAEVTDGVHIVCLLHFTDSSDTWTLTLRNSVLEVKHENTHNHDLKIKISESNFRKVIIGHMPLASSGISVAPSFELGNVFLSFFDDPKETFF